MSEVDLPSLAESGRNASEKNKSAAQEVDLALKECGFGLFHLRLILAAFFGLVSGIVLGNSTPYVLSEAECDLNMNLLQKGILNAMPFTGMLTSCVVAGFLTDNLGRKIFLIIGYGGTFIFTIVSGLSQTYNILIVAKLLEGAFFATAYSPVLALTSEFCHDGVRDRLMMVANSFFPIGQILVGLQSWGILMQNWNVSLFNGFIVLHTWNYYFLILSLWSCMACISYALLPESPMYYITQHQYDKAREVLIKVYKENTRKPADTFKYKDLWKDKNKHAFNEKSEEHTSIKSQLTTGLHNIKPMFQRPLLWFLILFCILNFISMKLYSVLRMWFPQLSAIFEHYSSQTSDMCVMLDTYTEDVKLRSYNVSSEHVCVPARSGTETYINNVILGTICFVPYVISGILVNKLGKRNLYLICGTIAIALTMALRWTNSKTAMVSLFSTDVAVSQVMASLTQTMVLEYFPTNIRSLAMSIVMTIGRTGIVVGNVVFPILLDMGCAVPFFALAAIVAVTTAMAMMIPAKKK
ncbi:synaptic vesicle glycoprotein 2B-like [Colias croceus]|uniref:synaptic vesicle glycoprotein 2B-like n=1 Tax=Colias crocea TaxID=72248 RepID=UPI001E27AE60|nr:synaptic vesicle glycoprotein 2B-like [Colias croceus]